VDERTIDTITRRVLAKLDDGSAVDVTSSMAFPCGVSARHCHISREHLDILFGQGYELQPLKELLQPDQFAAKETIALIGPRSAIYGVRILGPTRPNTQIEISLTDGFKLGIKAPIRDSGKLSATPGAVLVGPKGSVELEQGIIVAARHMHLEPARAESLGLRDGQRVAVRVQGDGDRTLIFENVLVRCGVAHLSEFHVDTDEANSAGLRTGMSVEVILNGSAT